MKYIVETNNNPMRRLLRTSLIWMMRRSEMMKNSSRLLMTSWQGPHTSGYASAGAHPIIRSKKKKKSLSFTPLL
jgi:hypothetical protein